MKQWIVNGGSVSVNGGSTVARAQELKCAHPEAERPDVGRESKDTIITTAGLASHLHRMFRTCKLSQL